MRVKFEIAGLPTYKEPERTDLMTEPNLPQDLTLLLVDDDKPFLTRLARAMETRGFVVDRKSVV